MGCKNNEMRLIFNVCCFLIDKCWDILDKCDLNGAR